MSSDHRIAEQQGPSQAPIAALLLAAQRDLRGGLPSEALEFLQEVERHAGNTDGLAGLSKHARALSNGDPPQSP
jgi:hypothetical protein